MSKRVIKLTESDLKKYISKIVSEQKTQQSINEYLMSKNSDWKDNTMYESETGNKWVITKEGKTSQGDPMREYEKICKGFKLLLVQVIKTTKEGTRKAYVKVILHLPNSEKIDMTVQEFKEDWIPMKELKDPLVHKLINNSEAFGEYKVSMSKVPGMKRY